MLTQRDRRRGRGGALTPTPVKSVALDHGIPVSHRIADALDVGAELGIVVAFGRIIPGEVLAQLPMLNLHLSLLPRWRGAAPVERAILAGDVTTGVSLMALDEGLDTGPVFGTITVQIGPEEHADELTMRLGELGTTELLTRLQSETGLGEATPQDGAATYAEKLSIEDRHLDFATSALECLRIVRIGRAWTTFRKKRFIVHSAHIVARAHPVEPGMLEAGCVATTDGALGLDVVQLEGRTAQTYAAFANGVHLVAPERLG